MLPDQIFRPERGGYVPTSSEDVQWRFANWLIAEARYERDEAQAEVKRLRERAARLESLLLDVLNVLPLELARRVEARMPALKESD